MRAPLKVGATAEVEFVVAASWAGWILTQQTFGIDELGVDDVSAQFLADQAEGQFRDVFHRRQQNAGVGGYGTDFQHRCEK